MKGVEKSRVPVLNVFASAQRQVHRDHNTGRNASRAVPRASIAGHNPLSRRISSGRPGHRGQER